MICPHCLCSGEFWESVEVGMRKGECFVSNMPIYACPVCGKVFVLTEYNQDVIVSAG